MVSADTARTVVGIVGNVISFFLFLSPLPTFARIRRKGSVEQYSAVPYLATLVNCMVWTLYGLPLVHPKSILVLTINGTGTIIEFAYIILFFIYSNDNKQRLQIVVVVIIEFLFVAGLTLMVLTFAHTHNNRSLVVGIVCILFNVFMYASPLAVMKLVIKTKSVEFMPFFLPLASFANGLVWLIYALIRFDPFITVPNGLGALFGLVQLSLYAVYYKSTIRQMAARKEKLQVDMGVTHHHHYHHHHRVIVNGDLEPKKIATTAATP